MCTFRSKNFIVRRLRRTKWHLTSQTAMWMMPRRWMNRKVQTRNSWHSFDTSFQSHLALITRGFQKMLRASQLKRLVCLVVKMSNMVTSSLVTKFKLVSLLIKPQLFSTLRKKVSNRCQAHREKDQENTPIFCRSNRQQTRKTVISVKLDQ